jgi:hypothetical protein
MTELQAYVLLFLIGFMALMLVILAIGQRRNKPSSIISAEILKATEAFGQAVQEHTQVNAVLALMEQFQDSPELLRNLSGHSHQVMAAALLSRVHQLGADIKVVEGLLSSARNSEAHGSPGAREKVERLETTLKGLFAKLESADQAVQEFGRQRTTA